MSTDPELDGRSQIGAVGSGNQPQVSSVILSVFFPPSFIIKVERCLTLLRKQLGVVVLEM